MNSLEILKQELINQKSILEEKGISVPTQNTNPSPSEITSAIQSISIGNADATATEEDVIKGKTFYAQSSSLRTGTLDLDELEKYKRMVISMVSYTGSNEIIIPTDSQYTYIRDYCYSVYDDAFDQNLFYKHNLTIPDNITHIGVRAFMRANLTGLLTVPSSCTKIESNAFDYTNIEEIVVHNGVYSASAYFSAHCPNLKKATLLEPISYMSGYGFAYCPLLEEIYFPSTMQTLTSSFLSNTTNVKFIKFTSQIPPSAPSTTFKTAGSTVLLVPYQYYNDYYTATNYQNYNNPIIGYGEFNTGDSLPSSITGYSISWHTTLDDAKTGDNPITTCPSSGTMYVKCTTTS